jgi:ABC-type multidrug transport system ATPase subunit
MSKTPDIRLLVQNFRAVDHADIIINGITVVAGENGSGKSSISKLLYFLYKTVANYNDVVKRQLYNNLKDIRKVLEIMFQELRLRETPQKRDIWRKEFQELERGIFNADSLDDESEKWSSLLSTLMNDYLHFSSQKTESFSKIRRDRINFIIKDILQDEESTEEIEDLISKLQGIIKNHFYDAKEKIDLRPTSVFKEELEDIFVDNELPQKFEVLEYGAPIISLESDHLSIPYNIQNAIYIDSPMMFHSDLSDNIHWDDLAELLIKSGNPNERHSIADIISQDIIKGDVGSDDSAFSVQDFVFKRADGLVFNLSTVATGIKAFSMLQLLLKNGSITSKTLLIIDEPESNLHPQWIIEYARIIVLLNKQIGVKFFLASHNPDMVSAIRYISEKEGTLSNVDFYLASKIDDKFRFNYLYLNKEIDPIFSSFNIAIERINKYGV